MKHVLNPADNTIVFTLTDEEVTALKEHGFGKFFSNAEAYIEARVKIMRDSKRHEFLSDFDKLSTQEQQEVMNIVNRRKQLAANSV